MRSRADLVTSRQGGRGSALAVLAVLAVLVAACSDDEPAAASPAAGGPSLPTATAIPDTIDDDLELPADADPVSFDYVEIVMEVEGEEIVIGALVADTIRRRTRGLMFRTDLPDETGMLFAFPVETRSPFWNQDTPMNIDIAFLDANGVALEVLRLAANDGSLVTPETPYLFALEMPAGWLADNGGGVGTRFTIPPGVVGLAE